MTQTKQCRKCKVEKPATSEYFHRDKSKRDGLCSSCKSCKKEYSREHGRKWRAANPEKHRENSRKYNEANPEKVREYQRLWREANREKKRKTNREYVEANREKKREYTRKWQKANPESWRAKQSRRRARKSAGEGTHTAADIKRQYKQQKGKCYYCHCKVGDTYHVDHIVPLARGGSNDPDNIVIACQTCNQSKGDKMPHEWGQGGRLL